MSQSHLIPLSVNLTGSVRHHYNEHDVLPAHELVIRPLLESSLYALVYKGAKEAFLLYGKMQHPINLEQEDILIPEKGKFRFNKQKECLSGHEYLWNAVAWKRGSIVMVLAPESVDFSSIFKHTYMLGFESNPNTGNVLSAIKKCKQEAEKGNIAVCISASNGIEYIYLYASSSTMATIKACAIACCKPLPLTQR